MTTPADAASIRLCVVSASTAFLVALCDACAPWRARRRMSFIVWSCGARGVKVT